MELADENWSEVVMAMGMEMRWGWRCGGGKQMRWRKTDARVSPLFPSVYPLILFIPFLYIAAAHAN